MPNGSFKTITVTNKDWTLDKGKKYMKSIEPLVIEEDIKKRKLKVHVKGSITLLEIVELYNDELDLMFKKQTSYAKKLALNKYVLTMFSNDKALEQTFTVQTIENYRKNIISQDLCQKRVNDLFRYLKELLVFAAEHEYLSYEYSRRLCSLLKSIKSQKEKEEKLCFWTNDEWNNFINSFDDTDKYKMLFEMTYKAALRIGEVLALTWEDFNYQNHTVSINKSTDNSGYVSSTKNSSSNATVTLPAEFCDRLLQYKFDLAASDNDFMFFGEKHVSRTNVRKVMSKHIELSGVPYIKFHGLRHSCASRMINAGVSPLIVSKHLRHSSVKETLDTYSHIFPNETVGIIDKIF